MLSNNLVRRNTGAREDDEATTGSGSESASYSETETQKDKVLSVVYFLTTAGRPPYQSGIITLSNARQQVSYKCLSRSQQQVFLDV